MDTGAYWARIGLDGPVAADAGGLVRMHRAHAAAIPFEGFDVLAGLGVRIEPEAVVAKLVTGAAAGRRRGGYCFEQNTLLSLMLAAAGFTARRCLARVTYLSPAPGGRTHLINLVDLDGRRVIADVGFGGYGLIDPLPVEPGREHSAHGEAWRVVSSPLGRGFEVQVRPESDWLPLYCFDPDETVNDYDLVLGNHFTSTHPQSRFRLNRIAARLSPDRRLSLLNGEMKIRAQGTTRIVPVGETELRAVLAEHFHLDLPDGMELPSLPPRVAG